MAMDNDSECEKMLPGSYLGRSTLIVISRFKMRVTDLETKLNY